MNLHNSKTKGKLINKRARQNKINVEEAQSEWNSRYDETMCRSCQFFNDEERCPYYGEVDSLTDHEQMNCKKFWS